MLFRSVPAKYSLKQGSCDVDDNAVDAIWLGRYAAAVDRGEVDFSGVYARAKAAKAVKSVKKAAVKASIKALGTCCGVIRKVAPFGLAKCPKCGKVVGYKKVSQVPSGPCS